MLMKIALSIFLAITLSIVTLPPIMVSSQYDVDEVQIISSTLLECPQFGFVVTEKVNEHYQVIRTFERNENIAQPFGHRDEIAEAKAILRLMGMDELFINHKPLSQLLAFANSPRLQTTGTYSRVDAYGNQTVIAPSVAHHEAELIQQARDVYGCLCCFGWTQNDIMFMNLGVAPAWGDYHPGRPGEIGWFAFSSSVSWLTTPFWRLTDSLGIVASYITTSPVDAVGIFSYVEEHLFFSRDVVQEITPTGRSALGRYGGRAISFRLPARIDPYEWVDFTEFRAHISFWGRIGPIHQCRPFAAIASYYHTAFRLGFEDITVSVDSGGVSASIGVSFMLSNQTKSHIELVLSYTAPNCQYC